MLELDPVGRGHALAQAIARNPRVSRDLVAEVVLAGIPAIVKTQEDPRQGYAEVGFSSHLVTDGVRLRLRSAVPAENIVSVTTPFDAMAPVERCSHDHIRAALAQMTLITREHGLQAGVYGSCALELLTGFAYITPESDIDILVKRTGGGAPDLAAFYKAATEAARRHGTRVDIEILLHDGAGVKLAELLSDQHTVLCKGLYGPDIRPREEVTLA